MTDPKLLLGPTRPPFLVLAPACALLGASTAYWATGKINWLHLALVLVGAVAAHISVNAFNEYFDFKSGLDATTRPTPFSGGSGTLPQHPELARAALLTACGALVVTMAIGLYFIVVGGWGILPLGLLGVLLTYAYTRWLVYNPITCLLAPGTGFGLVMVLATHYVLAGSYSWAAFVAALVPFFLVNNLLLLNQFPDMEADRAVGRKHFPILIGRRRSSLIYGLFLLLTYLAILIGVALKVLPSASLLGLGTLFLAVPAARNAYRYADDIPHLIPSLGLNVLINLLTPVLMAVGLILARLPA
jgi:1,4-dihydroxy-2-naphthoate octaprenyltransferase